MRQIGATEERIIALPKSKDEEQKYSSASFLNVTLSCDHRVVDGVIINNFFKCKWNFFRLLERSGFKLFAATWKTLLPCYYDESTGSVDFLIWQSSFSFKYKNRNKCFETITLLQKIVFFHWLMVSFEKS